VAASVRSAALNYYRPKINLITAYRTAGPFLLCRNHLDAVERCETSSVNMSHGRFAVWSSCSRLSTVGRYAGAIVHKLEEDWGLSLGRPYRRRSFWRAIESHPAEPAGLHLDLKPRAQYAAPRWSFTSGTCIDVPGELCPSRLGSNRDSRRALRSLSVALIEV